MTSENFVKTWSLDRVEYATRFDKLSMASCVVEARRNGAANHASGFFWRHAGQPVFITNWHVVTGNHAFTGQSKTGWSPDTLVVRYWEPTSLNEPATGNTLFFRWPSIELPLYDGDGAPTWLQHRDFAEKRVDVVVLSLPAGDTSRIFCVNDYGFEKLFHISGGNVFVVGFPLKANKNEINFPIWKSGSVASEILLPWRFRYPAFAIDARTSGGMSGSPTFARVIGPAVMSDLTTKLDAALTTEFLGVYSSRLPDDEGDPSIGLVWHRSVIDDILTSPAPGQRAI
ncbi:trypsin-like peptidase domain-containing protein [Bradyrhizobium sp. CW10]|uniref:trypsin-like peptidase domain-containing protein n=1 Tax=Bradyrhizobium sp. CW10 TaxID=2782683 RepID=UPI001FF9403A|nr:trypsin-like peptidase domain-containing protein [Bradyrhizobium sp. CW10]MCK1470360.1 trypsin-like peptidase domain-containing protein [Bradyrhizobium sp. CW10]